MSRTLLLFSSISFLVILSKHYLFFVLIHCIVKFNFFYLVIKLVVVVVVVVWENEKAVVTRAADECFHSFFEFSQTFTSVSVKQ